jgi:hypothetical protein
MRGINETMENDANSTREEWLNVKLKVEEWEKCCWMNFYLSDESLNPRRVDGGDVIYGYGANLLLELEQLGSNREGDSNPSCWSLAI